MPPKAIAISVSGKASRTLPGSFCRQIGAITVAWAHLEGYLQALSWELLNVDPGLGRIAVRVPRPKQQVEMIRDLAEHTNRSYDKTSLKNLLEKIESVSSQRDLITHGTWAYIFPLWYVMKTNGNWPKKPDAIGAPKGSRRVRPEGVEMGYNELNQLRIEIHQLIDLAKAVERSLGGELEA